MTKKAHPLVAQFAKAGLTLKIEDQPMRTGRGMADIVQIDVGRSLKGNSRREWFRMYLPNDPLIQIRNIDKDVSQLVLMVKEPKRTFEDEIHFSTWGGDNWADWLKRQRENLDRGVRIMKVYKPGSKAPARGGIGRRGGIIVERSTSEAISYYLMGVDERQLFIAQLTGHATTVKQAHSLLGSSVQFFGSKRKGSSLDRQGEWFFLETSKGDREAIRNAIKANTAVVHKKTAIGSHANRAGGNPHTVDELIKLPGEALEHGWPVRGERVFIRGKVRHVDHKTVRFSHWREVVANNEGATASASAAGVLWVD